MQLKLKRSQRTGGMLGGKAIFMLDAQVMLTNEEAHHVKQYKLGGEVVYNSERSRKHLENAQAGLAERTALGVSKGLARVALAKMSLNITIDGLTKGQHVECKSLDEMLGAEEAIRTACEGVKTYLNLAATFDGREEVVEY